MNAVGTNFMDFPELLRANRTDELARFSMVFVDGTSRFNAGQLVAFAGGWA